MFLLPNHIKVPKDAKFYSLFYHENNKKRELQHIVLNHSSDIKSKDFIMIYNKCTAERYSFLVNDDTLPLDSPLRFRKINLI